MYRPTHPYTFVMDFETANQSSASICAFGWAIVESGKITHVDQVLINPEDRFSGWNIKVHGIRSSDVANAPTLPEMLDMYEIHELIRGADHVVAHNASFDVGALKGALAKYGLDDFPHFTFSCTLKLARKVYPFLPNHKLNTLADHLGITLKHHDAADDARVAAELLLDMLRQTRTWNIDELNLKLGLRPGYLRGMDYSYLK
ncbi:3'-5' exonuclease [Exiguobacterium flavidum]|uniref:3'-5' exonuclease n=1 Tax=Exiguobacterium flavidum TaxID=2184695 RepID=UPI000DF7806E|nr:3'-5' exonuclease [Exiguobacterium flavidum]